MIQRLRRRRVLVKLPDAEKVTQVRVPVVPKSLLNAAQLEHLKTYLAKQVGKPRQQLEVEIAARAAQYQIPAGTVQTPPTEPPTNRATDFWQ